MEVWLRSYFSFEKRPFGRWLIKQMHLKIVLIETPFQFILSKILSMKKQHTFLLAAILIFAGTSLFSQGLEKGDKLKPFKATTDDGTTWSSKDYTGKANLVVYFYPAAMTGGCTAQACAYRDAMEDLSSLDAVVVGISGDKVENLALFKKAHNLNFPLLSDPDGEIAEMFGVPLNRGEKSIEREVEGMMHTLTRGVTTNRWTFVFDKTGKLVHKSTQVNAAEDSKEVIAVLENLN